MRCRIESSSGGMAAKWRRTIRDTPRTSRGENTTCRAPASRNSHWPHSNPLSQHNDVRPRETPLHPFHPADQRFHIRARCLDRHDASRTGLQFLPAILQTARFPHTGIIRSLYAAQRDRPPAGSFADEESGHGHRRFRSSLAAQSERTRTIGRLAAAFSHPY